MQAYAWSFYISRLSMRVIVKTRMVSPSQLRRLTSHRANQKPQTTYDVHIKIRQKRNCLSDYKKDVKLETGNFYNCKS